MLERWLRLRRAIDGYTGSDLDVEASVAGAILVSFAIVTMMVRFAS
jgi:hypothetical protein